VVEVRVVERRSTGGGDVLLGQVEAAAHRLAVERAGARQGEDGAELDRLAGARAGLLDPEHGGPVGLRHRAAATGRAGGRAVGRRVAGTGVVVVVAAARGEQRGRADRPGGAEQQSAARDPALVHDLGQVLVHL
jgi:hypothetical protein